MFPPDVASLISQATVQSKLRGAWLILNDYTPEELETWATFFNEDANPKLIELNRNMTALLMAGAELVRAGKAYQAAVDAVRDTPAPGV